jgi:hypothetical protein
MRLRSFFAAASLCCAAPALAQTGSRDFRQALGTNFIAIPFGVFSVDYERAVGDMGLGGLTYADNGERISWGQAKVKYYPAESSLRGFALGLTAGMMSARTRDLFCPEPFGGNCVDETRTESSPTLGVVIDYNWLLGKRQRLLLGIGAGARRVLKDVDENANDSPLEQVYPDGRFTVGFAF